jgi:hypothetical protein
MKDFWELKSDEQQNPEQEDSLDVAIMGMNNTYTQILRLCKAKLGSYVEIAYEWSWDEAISMIEVLDVIDELKRRDKQQSAAEASAAAK